jgi:hypothetical protein
VKLCENCLEAVTDSRAVPIGFPSGSQRDPEQDYLHLCSACTEALTGHDLRTFTARYCDTRTVTRA